MRTFTDLHGREWIATAHEEQVPRHHGRFYLVFHPADAPEPELAMDEVRWQSRVSAERTLRTMSAWELQRRLSWLGARAGDAHAIPLDATRPQPINRNTAGSFDE